MQERPSNQLDSRSGCFMVPAKVIQDVSISPCVEELVDDLGCKGWFSRPRTANYSQVPGSSIAFPAHITLSCEIPRACVRISTEGHFMSEQDSFLVSWLKPIFNASLQRRCWQHRADWGGHYIILRLYFRIKSWAEQDSRVEKSSRRFCTRFSICAGIWLIPSICFFAITSKFPTPARNCCSSTSLNASRLLRLFEPFKIKALPKFSIRVHVRSLPVVRQLYLLYVDRLRCLICCVQVSRTFVKRSLRTICIGSVKSSATVDIKASFLRTTSKRMSHFSISSLVWFTSFAAYGYVNYKSIRLMLRSYHDKVFEASPCHCREWSCLVYCQCHNFNVDEVIWRQ